MERLTSSDNGAMNELRVVIDLMGRGYKVFRAVNPNCPCDLIIYKEGELYKVEVRTAQLKRDGTLGSTSCFKKDRDDADIYAWVVPNAIIYEPNTF